MRRVPRFLGSVRLGGKSLPRGSYPLVASGNVGVVGFRSTAPFSIH